MTQPPTKSPAVSERDEIARIVWTWTLGRGTECAFEDAPSIRKSRCYHTADAIIARLAPAPEKGESVSRVLSWLDDNPLSITSPTPLDDIRTLCDQLTGRARFLRDRGEIKSPQLLEEAARKLTPRPTAPEDR